MKGGSTIFLRSKVALLLLCLSAGLLFTISSCKKDDDSTTTAVSEDDVAEAVSQSVSTESGGLVSQTTASAVIISTNASSRIGAKLSDECGIMHDTTFAGASVDGAAITYSYNFSWNWLLSCNNVMPQTFVFNYAGKAAYDAPRMSSSDSSKANVTVTGLGADSAYYVFNQSYTRNGSQTSKVNLKRSFTSLISIVSSDIRISKSTLKIISGTGTVTITGTGSGGKSFSYTGTITFLGNEKATLVVTGGGTYTIEW
ncbi:hypothetical protein SAMN05518672_102642 [Chitinophaga sp. CF118]|uniref:hypothetical protein n=1 Tax=Chitinophaga sp. CF118 TaxID=1884367 RepID=UPI0008EF2F5C|nr:hypothetical protein [Chitinophaga sp. CF118]SFD61860.1 hypothetical protein SAMN05518672_102642 [Chitinophaga sp. CF118]